MAKVLSRLDILLHANTANYRRDIKQATDGTKRQLKSVAEQAKIANQQMSQSAKREFATIANYGSQLKHQLGTTFTALGTIGLAQNIVQTADRMQDLASKVRINTQSTEEYMAVLHDLRKISTDYWTAIDGITDLYASSKRALDSLGASQREVLDFTRNITMAMSIGGGSAQAQEAALIQLGQAMNMGMLRGQEFNSVSAQAPVIIDLLTESLKVSRGELRQMAKEGKITSQAMKDAVLGGYDKLQNIINQMPTTFAQGLQNVKSQYDFLVDDIMNQNSLISQNLANAALWVADNFRTLVTAGAVVGTVWAANAVANSALMASMLGMAGSMAVATKASVAHAFNQRHLGNVMMTVLAGHTPLQIAMYRYAQSAKTAMTSTIAFARSLPIKIKSLNVSTASLLANTRATLSLATAQKVAINSSILLGRGIVGIGTVFTSLGRIIMAHPIITLVGVIGAVIARTEGLEGTIKSLGDAFSVAGLLAVDFIGGVVDGLGMAWTATTNYFDKLIGGSANATSFAQTAFGGFFANTEKGFVGVGQIIARTFDLGGATVVWFVNLAGKNIRALGTAVSDVFKGIGNFAISVFERLTHGIIDEINDLIKGFNLIKEFFGGSTIPLIGKTSFGRFEYGTPDFGGVGDIASYNQHGLENAWVNQYKELTNASNQANTANLNLAGSHNEVAKSADKNARAQRRQRQATDEATKAFEDMMKSYREQINNYHRQISEILPPFLTELSKIRMEFIHPYGKYANLPKEEKDNLEKNATLLDAVKFIRTVSDKASEWKKDIYQSYRGTNFDEIKYDLNDENNIWYELSRINFKNFGIRFEHFGELVENPIDFFQRQAINFDFEKAKNELGLEHMDIMNQIELSQIQDGLGRSFLQYEQEHKNFLEKYQGLLNSGFDADYNNIKKLADDILMVKKISVISSSINDYNYQVEDSIREHENQINLLSEINPLSKSLLEIENTRLKTLGEYNILLEQGYTEQYKIVETNVNLLADSHKKLVVQTAYHDLVQSLKTEEEKRLDTLIGQLDVLKAHAQITGLVLDMERAKQLISQTVGLATPTNHYDELNAKTAGQYASLDTGLQTLLDNERLTEEERIKIKAWGVAERTKIEKAHSLAMKSLVLGDGETIFSGLASITKDSLGEQSRLYRAMFAMQQGFAIAQAGLAMQQAISRGLAEGFPTGLADMALAVSHGAKIISAIKSVVMPIGQAHDGIMSVPKSGTWNLEKGERVLPKHTAQNLDRTLANLQGKRQGETKVIINNYTGEKASIEQQPNGDMMITIGKQMGQMMDHKIAEYDRKRKRQGWDR